MPLSLDEMLDGAAAGATTVAPGWGQGRATFGGLVAGLLVARAEALCADPQRRLRSASVSFVGPVTPGPATVEGEVLRAGSSVTQVQARIVQEGEVRAAMIAGFGGGRDTRIALDSAARNPRPELPAPETVQPIAYVEGITPEFFQHVDMRFASGSVPFAGAGEPDFGGWMRFAEPTSRFGDRELMALTDVWPPAIAPLLDKPAPMSTLAWTFEPVAGPPPGETDAPDAFWQYQVHTHASGHGYAHATARVWDERGTLRAISHQTIAYFA
jgi:acyl-CoA thioesterase